MMSNSRITWLSVSILALVVSALLLLLGQEPARPQTITVDDPRPLAAAILVLEQRYGWIVTYEDPPYEFAADSRDVTEEIRRSHDSNRRVLVPVGGPFSFSYATPETTRQPMAILERLLTSYHVSGHAGEFRVAKTGSVFHVLPHASRDVRGFRQIRASRLDTRITVEERKRTVMEMFYEIVRAASRPGAYTIMPGTIPTNLFIQTSITKGAKNEVARTVLIRTLAATGNPLSWRLLCDPGASAECALNVHLVQQPSGE